jgi:Arc/MetJ-type ribon-helix-helix transcriptional regulator
VKVTISLPKDLLAYVDRKQEERGETRSAAVRQALKQARRVERERELDEQYVRGYREQPETEDELHWAGGVRALDDVPWQPGERR